MSNKKFLDFNWNPDHADQDFITDLSADLIDTVEYQIRSINSEVDQIAINREGNTLLYGEDYFVLEDEIKRMIECAIPNLLTSFLSNVIKEIQLLRDHIEEIKSKTS